MTSYGVNTVNRFDLLSDDVPRAAPAPVAKPVESFEQQKPSAAPNARANDDRGERGRGGRGRGRGGRGRGRNGNLGAHGQNGEFENAGAEQVNYRQTDAQAGERRGRERLPGQTRQRFQDGHTPSRGYRGGVKRQGRGAFNVGHVADGAAPAETEQPAEVAEAAPVEEVAAEESKEAVAEVPVEEEDNTLTLDQYLAKQQELLVADDLNKNLRVAGQDVQEDDFNPAKELSRDEETDESILGGAQGGAKVSAKYHGVKSAHHAAKAAASADFFANSASVFNRSRGGRGGYSRQSRQAPVNVADQSAFPSLGKR